jgi:hypothetical protein
VVIREAKHPLGRPVRAKRGFSLRRAACAVLASAVVVTAVRADGIAAPNGKTWTSEIAAGAGLLYYIVKLNADNAKADRTGRAADAVIDWAPLSPALTQAPQKPVSTAGCPAASPMPAQPTSMRSVRSRLINDIVWLKGRCPASFASMRARYENLRTCWNAFVYAQPAAAKTTPSGDAKPSANVPPTPSNPPVSPAPAPRASPAARAASGSVPSVPPLPAGGFTPPAPAAPPQQSAPGAPAANGAAGQVKAQDCTGDFDAVDASYAVRPPSQDGTVQKIDETIDMTDLQSAVSSAPALSQQIVDLRVGSHIDDDALRAHFLYLAARALDDAILGRQAPFQIFSSPAASGSGFIDVTSLSTSCVFSLDPKACITALGTAEATAAANRRLDVSCDVARRSWLPSYTAIVRRRSDARVADTADLEVDRSPFFGAVPGC